MKGVPHSLNYSIDDKFWRYSCSHHQQRWCYYLYRILEILETYIHVKRERRHMLILLNNNWCYFYHCSSYFILILVLSYLIILLTKDRSVNESNISAERINNNTKKMKYILCLTRTIIRRHRFVLVAHHEVYFTAE